jgi:hypothetical protein
LVTPTPDFGCLYQELDSDLSECRHNAKPSKKDFCCTARSCGKGENPGLGELENVSSNGICLVGNI